MATKVSICNMALTHIGAKNQISNLDTDQSAEAKQCRIYWDDAVKFVLSQVDWNFAKAITALAEIDETDPTTQWSYIYSLPADCVKFRGIYNSLSQLIPYEIRLNQSATIKAIYTNEPLAYATYTIDIKDTNLFTPTFNLMLSYYLASLISYALTKKRSLRDDMIKAYNMHKLIAEANDCQEEEPQDLDTGGNFISVRS